MASFTKEQVTEHLISLGVKKEHLIDGYYSGMLKIRGEVVPICPDASPNIVDIDIDFGSREVKVDPYYAIGMNATEYADLNRYFDKRIKEAYSRLIKLVQAAKTTRSMADHKTQEMKDKFAELFRVGGEHLSIRPSETTPGMYFKWFGSAYNVDSESGEVCLGYGMDQVKIPIEVAIEFLNECKVYKLLEG